MEWFSVIFLVLLGITLIVLEVIFIPGTTVVGVVGFGISAYAIYLSYERFGTTAGTIVLITSGLISVGAIIYSFRSGAWDRFSLRTNSEGKVNEGLSVHLSAGMEGKALSTLRPVGKADFGGEEYEVVSHGNYINTGQKVKIVKIDGNRITVEPI